MYKPISIFLIMFLFSCKNKVEYLHSYSTLDTNYKNGELLLPDDIHDDTLVVIDANYLNERLKSSDFENREQVSGLISITTKSYPYKSYQYNPIERLDGYYVNGQILLPDYIHNDSLIVTDAQKLNWLIENTEPKNDSDIIAILNLTTKLYNP